MASIKEVAKHAGVSISTVSKVLNSYPNISEETKRKVNVAIEELGYVPNAVAAALSSKKCGRIAIVLHLNQRTQAMDEVRMQSLVGAMQRAKELRLDVITVFYSMLEGKSADEAINYFRSQSITGILVLGPVRNKGILSKIIEKQVFKMVLVDTPIVNESTSCVWINQANAQYDVAKATMELDTIPYKKVLYIAGKRNTYVAEERIKGIKQFVQDHNMKVMIKDGDFSEKKAREWTFKYGEKVDMIACASDLMAIGAMRALIEMDISRPVCGFDGLTLMGYAGKQMYTVKQNFYYVAEEAVSELNCLLKGGTGKEVVLDYTLVRLTYEDVIQ